jgi:hypothetical protein
MAGFMLAGLAGVAMLAGDAKAQSGSQAGKLRLCQQECAGDKACLRTCGGSATKTKVKIPPPTRPDPEPEPPAVKSWQEEVFLHGTGGGAGGSGGGR